MSEADAGNHLEKREQIAHLMSFVERIVNTLNKTDEAVVAQNVAALREKYPDATPAELVEKLIRRKCWQTGAIGAATSSTGVIPGLGTAISLTFGLAADIGMTLKLQTELVLEIIQVYQHELSLTEKRNLVILITGLTLGTNRLLSKLGLEVAERATVRLEERAIAKAIPVLGVAASAGIDIVSTYLIGRRAQAYFQRGPQALDDWGEGVRAITGIDERKLSVWLANATEQAWQLTSSGGQAVAGSLLVAGKATGKFVVSGAGKAGALVSTASKQAGRGIMGGVRKASSSITKRKQNNGEK